MCVCVCVCVCVCACACVRACVYLCIGGWMHADFRLVITFYEYMFCLFHITDHIMIWGITWSTTSTCLCCFTSSSTSSSLVSDCLDVDWARFLFCCCPLPFPLAFYRSNDKKWHKQLTSTFLACFSFCLSRLLFLPWAVTSSLFFDRLCWPPLPPRDYSNNSNSTDS